MSSTSGYDTALAALRNAATVEEKLAAHNRSNQEGLARLMTLAPGAARAARARELEQEIRHARG